ncbi:MAG: hypothetical protein IMF09_04765 [Proteobacteria bacterium]|nr:hypothetical protein [Pseudomonadota bacterium]
MAIQVAPAGMVIHGIRQLTSSLFTLVTGLGMSVSVTVLVVFMVDLTGTGVITILQTITVIPVTQATTLITVMDIAGITGMALIVIPLIAPIMHTRHIGMVIKATTVVAMSMTGAISGEMIIAPANPQSSRSVSCVCPNTGRRQDIQ